MLTALLNPEEETSCLSRGGGSYLELCLVTNIVHDFRSKITFIAWSPDNASLMVRNTLRHGYRLVTRFLTSSLKLCILILAQPKMMYSSSKDALKRSLNGLAADIQANDDDDIEYATIIQRVSRGR